MIAAFGLIKKCAAKVNIRFGLDKEIADAIIIAAEEVQNGVWREDFIYPVKHFLFQVLM